MVKERIVSLTWLRKQIEQADTDLLREMLKTMAGPRPVKWCIGDCAIFVIDQTASCSTSTPSCTSLLFSPC